MTVSAFSASVLIAAICAGVRARTCSSVSGPPAPGCAARVWFVCVNHAFNAWKTTAPLSRLESENFIAALS